MQKMCKLQYTKGNANSLWNLIGDYEILDELR